MIHCDSIEVYGVDRLSAGRLQSVNLMVIMVLLTQLSCTALPADGPGERSPTIGFLGATPDTIQFRTVSTADVPSTVTVNYLSFDPLTHSPLLPEGADRQADGTWLVQFEGPITPTMKRKVTEKGATLLQYYPMYAFSADIDGSDVGKVSGLECVRSVTPFRSYYKIDPNLLARTTLEDEVRLNLLGWHGTGGMVELLEKENARMVWSDELIVTAFVRPSSIPALAASPHIDYIFLDSEISLQNNNAARIVDARQENDGAFNDDRGSLWAYGGGDNGTFSGITNGTGAVVSIIDSGVADHPAFPEWKRKWFGNYTANGKWFDNDGHGTHVAGTAVGTGAYWNGTNDGKFAGVAPGAGLVGIAYTMGGSPYSWNRYSYIYGGANLSSNSWGYDSFNVYDVWAAIHDYLVKDVEYYLDGEQDFTVVFAAGNNGDTGISSPGTAKNVITVGATGNNKAGLSAGQMATFSGRGPVEDGRIKPDIVAPGKQVWSTGHNGTPYLVKNGTSMATPVVAGAAALIYSHWASEHGTTPSAALVKALLLGSAVDMPGYELTGGEQGWGRLNIADSLLEESGRSIRYLDEDIGLETGSSVEVPLTVNGNGDVRIQLVWTDPHGGIGSSPALVNDLDLAFIGPDREFYLGNNFIGGYSTHDDNERDLVNNVEGIRLKGPGTGSYTIQVRGTNVPEGPQRFALVVTGGVTLGTPRAVDTELEVSNLTLASEELIEGDEVTMRFQVRNSGNDDVPGFSTDFGTNNWTEERWIEGIPSGGTVTVEKSFVLQKGVLEINVQVDDDDRVCELDEDDNVLTQQYYVEHYAFSINITQQEGLAPPGRSVEYRIIIKNIGSMDDSYNITVLDPPDDWPFVFSAQNMSIRAGKWIFASFTVTTPPKAMAGTVINSTILVTSNSRERVNQSFWAKTVVDTDLTYDIVTSELTQRVDLLGQALFNISLINKGNGVLPFELSISGVPSNWYGELSHSFIYVDPFETDNVSLVIIPPEEAPADTVRSPAVSILGPDGEKYEFFFMVIVETEFGMNLSTEEEVHGTIPATAVAGTLHIHNEGNVDDNMVIVTAGPVDWEISTNITYVSSQAFRNTPVSYSIRPPQGTPPGNYTVGFEVTGTERTVSLNVTVYVGIHHAMHSSIPRGPVIADTNGSFGFWLDVGNTGNVEDSYRCQIDNGTVADIGPIAAMERDNITVEFALTNSTPGNHSVFLVLTSRTDPAVTWNATLVVNVPEPPPNIVPGPGTSPDPDVLVDTWDRREAVFMFTYLVIAAAIMYIIRTRWT